MVTSKSLTAQERSLLEERVHFVAKKSDFSKEDFAKRVLELLEKR